MKNGKNNVTLGNDAAPQSSATISLRQRLEALDAEAEKLLLNKKINPEAVKAIRQSIAYAIEDLSCPPGKESARRAIPDLRGRIKGLRLHKSVSPASPLTELNLTDERV